MANAYNIDCLKCGFVTENEYAHFCQECGNPIVNTCTECFSMGERTILPQSAKYCTHCGEVSLFKQEGLLG